MAKHRSPHDATGREHRIIPAAQRLACLRRNSPAHVHAVDAPAMASDVDTDLSTDRDPPQPPVQPNPASACDPSTPPETLWEFARSHPELRYWIIANPNASAEILEYIAQQGGPGVVHGLEILLASLESE